MRLDLTGPRPRLDLHDPALMLTEPQKRAMAFDREVIVTAGAGAGKTHVLSLRYVALLLELAAVAVEHSPRAPRPQIASVLVLTFTEKASGEMAERCYRRLSRLARLVRESQEALSDRYGTGYGRGLAAAMDWLIDSFPRGQLSTFHAFCARVLREFPASCGTPPGFSVLEPMAASEHRSQVLQDALQKRLQTADLPLLLDAFGSQRQVLEAAHLALQRRADLRDRLTDYANERITLADLLAAAPVTPAEARAWLETVALPALDTLARLLAGRPFARTVLEPILARIRENDRDPCTLSGLYRDALGTLITPKGTLRQLWHHTVMGARNSWPHRDQYDQAKHSLMALAEELQDWPGRYEIAQTLPTRADQSMLRALGAFGRLLEDAQEALNRRFEEEGVLDFAEMQLRAVRTIVDDDAVRQTLQQRYRYLMIDEFQDTNALQLSLVLGLGRPPGYARDRIFLVGDVKQAIYGFRGGDVTVFSRAVDALEVSPVVLPHNFRSKPELISWFNDAFRTILGDPGPARPAHEAPYTPLEAGRTDMGGTVTLITATRDQARTLPDAWQADAAVQFMKNAWLEGAGMNDTEAYPTPPIALLLRARTHLASYEAALRAEGIPFVVSGGVGFWEKPEVVDLVNLLHGLCADDPLSIVGALRSPLLALPDSAVEDLVKGRQPWPTLGAVFGFPTESPPPPRLADVSSRWRAWQHLRHRVPSATLLLRILRDCNAPAVHAQMDPSGQAAANARQLIAKAHALDLQGVPTDRIARSFLEQISAGSREAEAPIDPGAARVAILTVHASKGLEFPAVLVPELSAKAAGAAPPLEIQRLDGTRWDLACRILDPDAPVQTRVRPGTFLRMQAQRAAEEQAERARLLYVAATRARDHLAFVGISSAKAAETPSTWMQWLEAHHGTPPTASGPCTVLEATTLLSPAASTPSPEGPRAHRSPSPPLVLADPVEVTPSALGLYAACPARWAYHSLLGIPAIGSTRASSGAANRALALARGDVLHGVLEDGLLADDAQIRARWEARCSQGGLSHAEADAGRQPLFEHITACRSDPWLTQMLAHPGEAELSFRIAHENVLLTGQIDRLYLDGSEWVVLDFKSDAVPDAGDPSFFAKRAEHHRPQLLAYAWSASQILQDHGHPPITRAALYFTAVGVHVPLTFTEADHRSFSALLASVGATAREDWSEIVEEAIQHPRPCTTCPAFRRGCRGRVS